MSNGNPVDPSGATDDATIRGALLWADPMALRASLYQLTGRRELRCMRTEMQPALIGEIPGLADPADVELLQNLAFEYLRARDGHLDARTSPVDPERLREAVRLCLGDDIEDDLELWLEESGLPEARRSLDADRRTSQEHLDHIEVLVIGAGIGGIAAAVELGRHGVKYSVIEKNAGVGGTWFENSYPGARVDLPSRHYSFTFEADYDWEHFFAPQAEIRAYLQHCAEKYAVIEHVRFQTEVVRLTFDESESQWIANVRDVTTGDEHVVRADAVISAVGMLNRASIPELPGLEQFSGPVMHTSAWDHSIDLSTRSVAVIGTGASGMQLVPEIADGVRHLTVFQRTPAWVLPIPAYREPVPAEMRWLFTNLPYYVNWFRVRTTYMVGDSISHLFGVDAAWTGEHSVSEANEALRTILTEHLETSLADRPDLLEKCTPRYPPFSKRFVADNGWFEAVKRPNVDLVTDRIQQISKSHVVVESGEAHNADVIVLATGFNARRFIWPMEVIGRQGLKLEDAWRSDGPRAYLGVMVPGFPNLFCLYGPNTNPRTGGVTASVEMQVRFALECLCLIGGSHGSTVEVRQEAYDGYNRRLDSAMASTVWADRRAHSYYRDDLTGRVVTNSPWTMSEYWRLTRAPRLDDLEIR